MDIGGKIRQLRVKNQLTLEELANRSELTKGFLSQVERNLTSPSIATLEDILEALGTSLGDFFAPEKDEQIVFTEEDYFINEQEDHTIAYIVPNAQKNHMEPILLILPPGGRSEKMEPYEGEEFGYVLRGKITLVNTSKDEKIDIRKGETFYLKGNDEHYFINESERIAKFLWICTPPVF